MKIALVHDALTERSGAERSVLELARALEEPVIITSIYEPGSTFEEFASLPVHALHRPSGGTPERARRQAFTNPSTFRSLRLDAADLVVVSSVGYAHHVRHPRSAVYWHTAPWSTAEQGHPVRAETPLPRTAAAPLRRQDREAVVAHPLHLANSYRTADRLQSSYGIETGVLHPPIDPGRLAGIPGHPDWPPRALVVSRLLAQKRLDVAILACRELSIPLTIIGEGPDEGRLRGMADRSVTFVSAVSDAVLAAAYASHAVVMCPGQDDFGLVALEATYSGRPVVASSAGGGMETILHRETGWLVGGWDPLDWADALRAVLQRRWDPLVLRSVALRFERTAFRAGIAEWLEPLHESVEHFGPRKARQPVGSRSRSLMAS